MTNKLPTATIKQRENQPEFVVGNFGFEFEKLVPYVNDKGFINFDILKGKESGQYVKVNDYGIKKDGEELPY